MSLKAGRVGVNPADVDPVDGHISPSSVDSYTKAQADAKFETQTAAASEHALLQPKTLALPIKYLNGSVIGIASTVEDILHASYGSDDNDPAKTNKQLTDDQKVIKSECTDIVEGASVSASGGNHVVKNGKVVSMQLALSTVTIGAWSTFARIPEGFRPSHDIYFIEQYSKEAGAVLTGGSIQLSTAKISQSVRIQATWIID